MNQDCRLEHIGLSGDSTVVKDKNMVIKARGNPLPSELEEISILSSKLSEADRTRLLRYLISQSMDQVSLGEILKAVAHRIASGTLGMMFLFLAEATCPTFNRRESDTTLENSEVEQRLALHQVA